MTATLLALPALNDAQRVAIRVPNYQSSRKPEFPVVKCRWAGRDEGNGSGTERPGDGVNAFGFELRLAMHQVIGAFIGRVSPAVARAQIFEKLNTRSRRSA